VSMQGVSAILSEMPEYENYNPIKITKKKMPGLVPNFKRILTHQNMYYLDIV
jgi:hypothetical protein